jgi:L,D-peptidoglycan transpeptidase YkuD (ErfK/YbiS/YcfS/YnhG family)
MDTRDRAKTVISIAVGVTLAVSLTLFAMSIAPAGAATNTRIPTATRFIPNPATQQAIVVKTATWGTSNAQVETWSRTASDQPWRMLRRAPGRVGRNGVKLGRREGDGTTPAGGFRLLWGFGTGATPNTKGMVWRTFDSNDWWVGDVEDPPTYNTYQPSRPTTARWRTSRAEHLWDFQTAYRYAWVIDFNRPRYGTRPSSEPQPNVQAGSAIFLHVGTGATAGCVAVAEERALSISQWLDPSKRPVIVIGQQDWLVA